MTFSIPILIEERVVAESLPPNFVVRPLFASTPAHSAEKLGRALNKLTSDLLQELRDLGREPRHDELAGWSFHPDLEETTLDLRLELGSGSRERRFFLVGYEALGRKLFFTPTLPELHFEVLPGQALAERAVAVLTQHFRQLEKEDGPVDLDAFALRGRARLTTIDLALDLAALAKKRKPSRRALLFGSEEKKDGAEELRKTGRALDQLYPDDLDRAVGRDREVEELARLLASPDRRPIVLVGPRKVGKTTILHELAWRIAARKKERYARGRQIWLLSPMRLISGMSFLGEWESRVLAILEHARQLDRVLYFDDLVGLLTAGVHCGSDLNVAQVLRPALEQRRVRVIAEITPEAWRVLRERDRAFADLFHVIPIQEPPEQQSWRVLIALARQLEERYRCAFSVDALPAVFELHERFAGDAAFPGKAAGFLRRLAVRHGNTCLSRSQVLEEFKEQSGLQLAFLDARVALSRSSVVEALAARVQGQAPVLEAFADILVTLKARLNDPRRPLGTLLLLGPTGVGKTESAKALANCLFGSPDKLVRFDMNEFVDAAAVPRLVGTLRDPEGLLTSAIRRQPFSVVLFDEIEKAAPEVFDLLLAVLDEGRLTDALGRVADFTNTIILMTSNLGVRESRTRPGFKPAGGRPEADDTVFVSAAEKFFRPEFFNRLDRVVPFRPLEPAHLERIARQRIADVFARDGLRRRECLLDISGEAISWLVELGYHPELGARALKRVIEEQVAQPLAERLAVLAPGTPSLAELGVQEDQAGKRLRVHLHELRPAPRSVFWPEQIERIRAGPASRLSPILDGVAAALDRIERQLEADAPKGKVSVQSLRPEHARYFTWREQLAKVDRLAQAANRPHAATPRASPGTRLPRAKPTKPLVRQSQSTGLIVGRLRDAAALKSDLKDCEATEAVDVAESPVTVLARELALLEALTTQPVTDGSAVLILRAMNDEDGEAVFRLAGHYHGFFNEIWGVVAACVFPQPAPGEVLLNVIFGEPHPPPVQALWLSGCNLHRLVPAPSSTTLVRRNDGRLGLVQLEVRPASSLAEAKAIAGEYLPVAAPAAASAHTASAPSAMSSARAVRRQGRTVPEDPVDRLGAGPSAPRFGPVLQLLAEGKSITDFRTGLVVPAEAAPDEFRALLLSALPLPAELQL